MVRLRIDVVAFLKDWKDRLTDHDQSYQLPSNN